jgi:hypothetical protein
MWVSIYALALAAAVCFSAANLSRQLGQAEALANAVTQAAEPNGKSVRDARAGSVKSRDSLSQRELNDAV